MIRPSSSGAPRHSTSEHERPDLARREVDHRDDQPALELVAGVVGDLGGGALDRRSPRRSRSSASRRACAPRGSRGPRARGRRACRRRGTRRSRWSSARSLRAERKPSDTASCSAPARADVAAPCRRRRRRGQQQQLSRRSRGAGHARSWEQRDRPIGAPLLVVHGSSSVEARHGDGRRAPARPRAARARPGSASARSAARLARRRRWPAAMPPGSPSRPAARSRRDDESSPGAAPLKCEM